MSEQFIIAGRGGNAFALPIRDVLRVTMSPRICEAPLMPTGFIGVIDYDGEAVPVWDPFPDSADAMWGATVIVAQSADGRLGVLSDAPPVVASADTGAGGDRPKGPMWESVVKVGKDWVPVLDPKRFGSQHAGVQEG